jgi:hypothetical protein
MATAKVTPNRLRKSRVVRSSRTEKHGRKVRIPPELRAPMTRKIEQRFEQLVTRFGERKGPRSAGPTDCEVPVERLVMRRESHRAHRP